MLSYPRPRLPLPDTEAPRRAGQETNQRLPLFIITSRGDGGQVNLLGPKVGTDFGMVRVGPGLQG